MAGRVLPSLLEDELLDAFDINCAIEFEPEYLMGEFDRNPDIDEKPPSPERINTNINNGKYNIGAAGTGLRPIMESTNMGNRHRHYLPVRKFFKSKPRSEKP